MSVDIFYKDGLIGQVTNTEKTLNTAGMYCEDNITLRPNVVYGFHIDSSESDPEACVTYLEDAVGMTPAHMDYANSRFDYGSWEHAFFMPRPCMLKYDGTVDYYLNPNDYTKKMDGTASDAANDAYGGNAMMEWGRDGRKIWYKIVPDTGDNTSASVYISNYQVDSGYHAWSFINNSGQLSDHFYTAIYDAWVDGNSRIRSISGKAPTTSMTAGTERASSQANNLTGSNIWDMEVFCDYILISLLLILMSKTLNSRSAFGAGRNSGSSKVTTGGLNTNGLFFGYNTNTSPVKIFGMENWYGQYHSRMLGFVTVNRYNRYKMTRGTEDGSTVSDYVVSDTASAYDGYLTGGSNTDTNNYIRAMKFDGNQFSPGSLTGGSFSTYWCAYEYGGSTTPGFGSHGCDYGDTTYVSAYSLLVSGTNTRATDDMGTHLSCKP